MATDRGLLLRPHFLSETHVESYICIPWGKNAAVEELPHGEEFDHIDWSEISFDGSLKNWIWSRQSYLLRLRRPMRM